jgi:DNA-binding response OmpR family regulator
MARMPSARILIIEDDPAILFGLRDNFTRAGYEVKTAVDGRLGLDLARSWGPELILLDLMLPGLDGWQVCRELRSAENDVPIIMLTALGQEEQVIKGLNLGADDYVTKPFSIHELIARVAAFLRRRQRGLERSLPLGPCQVNLTAKEVTRAGVPVELTPKEFGLLEYLLKNPGRALTRDQILNAVWGLDAFVTERSVDRAMTLLRQKIEADPHRPVFLKTVQKIGYRLELD